MVIIYGIHIYAEYVEEGSVGVIPADPRTILLM